MTPSAVIFDLDGTLVDSAPAIRAVASAFLATLEAAGRATLIVQPLLSCVAQEIEVEGAGGVLDDLAGGRLSYAHEGRVLGQVLHQPLGALGEFIAEAVRRELSAVLGVVLPDADQRDDIALARAERPAETDARAGVGLQDAR